MDFYKPDRRRGARSAPPQPMCFDNTACFDGEVQSSPHGEWSSRLADRNSSGHQLANAFHFNDNQSSVSTTYSLRPEGHIYEEVGPGTAPYCIAHGDMEGRIPSVHQALDHHHHLRGSPSSLCSMCTRTYNTNRGPSPPSLPLCNCVTHGVPQPLCANHHGSLPQHQIHTPRSVSAGHTNPARQFSPTSFHDLPHQGTPCSCHQSTLAATNQRYTAAAGTMTADSTLHNSQETPKPKDRSLSPFAFLRKSNRDSKGSANTMLDSASGKSVLLCSRRWLVAIALTLVLIVILSVAVGLVVTFVVQKSGTERSTTTESGKAAPIERLTGKLKASVHVVSGVNSVFQRSFKEHTSSAFQTYSQSFTQKLNDMLKRHMPEVVDYTQVSSLSNGSVIVNFTVILKHESSEVKAKEYASEIQIHLKSATNGTYSSTGFSQYFPLDTGRIRVIPWFKDDIDIPVQPRPVVTTFSTTLLPTTTKPTTAVTTTTEEPHPIPPASGICQPITNEVCQRIHYNSSGTTYPNFAGHKNQEEASSLITVINAIMAGTSCYDHLNTFSCALLAPKCGENQARIPPCRSLCEEAFSQCGTYMEAVMTPQMANCSLFPNSTDPDVCVSESGPVVPTVSPTCPSAEFFSCDDNMCHPLKDRCDSVKDCEDEGDEANCEGFQCVPGQFQCSNGNCRPNVWKCDGRNDCGDNSDEEGCEPVPPCQRGEFKCTNGHDVWNNPGDVCIQAKFTCDGTNDCSDGSDEDSYFCRDRQ